MSPANDDRSRPGWTLMWSDEFEGDAVDRSKWDFDVGNGFYDYKNHAWVAGWGNEELQYYTHEPENVVVRESCLFVRAVKAPLLGCGYTKRFGLVHVDYATQRRTLKDSGSWYRDFLTRWRASARPAAGRPSTRSALTDRPRSSA